jgi:hypothetical protein
MRTGEKMSVKSMLFVVAMALALPLLSVTALAQERWAAIAPNGENSSTVVRATTKDQAEQLAIDACQRVSDTCASRAASTDGMNNYFAIMCCTQPRMGCAAGVASTKRKALDEVKSIFSDEGFTNCSLKNYIKAGTGEKS